MNTGLVHDFQNWISDHVFPIVKSVQHICLNQLIKGKLENNLKIADAF